MTIRRILIGLVVASGALWPRPAAADNDDAEQLYHQGQTAYDAKQYDAALAAWKRSYELSKLPGLLFNIAQAHRLAGHCSDAVANYRQFVTSDPQASERGDAEEFIRTLSPCPTAKPPVVTKPPITRSDAGRTKRLVGYGLGGVAIASLGAAAWFGYRANSIASDLERDCAARCSWDAVRDRDADGRAAGRNHYIALGVGGATALSAGIVWWLGKRERERAASVAPANPSGSRGTTKLQLAVAPHRAGASIRLTVHW